MKKYILFFVLGFSTLSYTMHHSKQQKTKKVSAPSATSEENQPSIKKIKIELTNQSDINRQQLLQHALLFSLLDPATFNPKNYTETQLIDFEIVGNKKLASFGQERIPLLVKNFATLSDAFSECKTKNNKVLELKTIRFGAMIESEQKELSRVAGLIAAIKNHFDD